MKLAVEVVGAHELPAKRRSGGVRAFVQVDFAGQRQATAAKPHGERSPAWNETLVFAGGGGGGFLDRAIKVGVYHRRQSGGKSCLGRVRLFGSTAAPAFEEAVLLRCPLDKPSFFAAARGEVVLRLYMLPHSSPAPPTPLPAAANAYSSTYATTLDDTASSAGVETIVGGASTQSAPTMRNKKPKPPVQRQSLHSIPAQSSAGTLIFKQPPIPPPAKAQPIPPPAKAPPIPPLAKAPPEKAPAATTGNSKSASYLIVDRMEFLYVNVVGARRLAAGDPSVEVWTGNHVGVTGRPVQRSPSYTEWNQVFAFSKEHLQGDSLEVVVMDKGLLLDGFAGKVVVNISDVPTRAPPGGPVAPQWHALQDAKGHVHVAAGEIMLAAWKGTQEDEAFAGALHAGSGGVAPSAAAATQTKSYHSPRLCYLRCGVVAAQDLVLPDRSSPRVFVRVELGAQRWRTKASQVARSANAKWDEEFFLVGAWPFEEPLVVTVMTDVSPGKDEVLGRIVLPGAAIKTVRFDKKKFTPPPPAWFDLEWPHSNVAGGGAGRDDGGWRHEIRSKIQLRVYYDAAYHVLDELTPYSSDFQPSAKPLRSPAIGTLELGVLRATGLPLALKPQDGGPRRAVDPYCVAKYGQKWVRTRTLVGAASPVWQEQFTFDVFDPCTVLTVAVLDNNQLAGQGARRSGTADESLGKVRIRVSTLTAGRMYEHPYSLFVVHPAGVRPCGELHLAVRLTLTAWATAMRLYLRPTLPNQHFAKPMAVDAITAQLLRRFAVDAVAARLLRAEPPLRPEAVHYILRDPAAHVSPAVPETKAYSRRRSAAAFARLAAVLAPAGELARWYGGVRDWKSPATTVLVLFVFLLLLSQPRAILPTFFLYLFAVGAWSYRWRPQRQPQMEHYADGVPPDMLHEEFDGGPASRTSPEIVASRYCKLRLAATDVQERIGDLARQCERAEALLSWKDRRATAVALVVVAVAMVVFYVVPFRVVVGVAGVYDLRHPWLRRKAAPSAAMNFFKRLPTNAEAML